MALKPQSEPDDQFLTIDETARLLGLDASDIRQGIACGLVPIRRDNRGALRIHQVEVPTDLLDQLKHAEIIPHLQVESLNEEVSTLRGQLESADELRLRLESLLQRQANALARSTTQLESSEGKIAKLIALLDRSMNLLNVAPSGSLQSAGGTAEHSNDSAQLQNTQAELQKSQEESAKLQVLLTRAYAAMEKFDTLADGRTTELTTTTDKAMQLLDRAVTESETAKADVNRLNSLVERTLGTSARIEAEIDQRNGVIEKQHELMDRLVKISEQSAGVASPAPKRRRTFWQRLWGGGKGI